MNSDGRLAALGPKRLQDTTHSNGLDSSSTLKPVIAKLAFPHYRFEKKESVMKPIHVMVELAKYVFQIHGVNRSEKTIWQRKLVRSDWIKVLMDRIDKGCEIGIEVWSGAH